MPALRVLREHGVGDGGVCYFGYPHGDHEYATHWMPLPAKPTAPTTDEVPHD